MKTPSSRYTLPDQESKPAYVREGFNTIANHYDRLNDLMTLGLHRRWKKGVIRCLRLQPGMTILDLCAGTGDLARYAVSYDPAAQVCALDFSWEMMKQGLCRHPGPSHAVTWINGDAMHLPFASATFDRAMVGFGLRNVAHLDQTLSEILRVLKPGGRFVSLDTAAVRWKCLLPFWSLYMEYWVPLLGKLLARSQGMYGYLSASSSHFLQPGPLSEAFQHNGFIQTGYTYQPRWLGGAALVWGDKPR
jgi:demethylmenaquinone methyltransferase/2-methoxy-6-polyprenyl-1,4-benzoquinol methylase